MEYLYQHRRVLKFTLDTISRLLTALSLIGFGKYWRQERIFESFFVKDREVDDLIDNILDLKHICGHDHIEERHGYENLQSVKGVP